MDRKYSKHFRTLLDQMAPERIAGFEQWMEESLYLWPGERAYARTIDKGVRQFIVFSPHEKEANQFTVELGWSVFDRFPEIDMRPSPRKPDPLGTEFEEPELLVRLGLLMGKDDFWWRIPTTSEPKEAVKTALEASFEALARYGLPYLDQFCEKEKPVR